MTSHRGSPASSIQLTKREREHLEVATAFGSTPFSSAEFKDRYLTMFPHRPRSSIIPSDYCVDHHVIGNESFPRFLLWEGRALYRLTTLQGPPSSCAATWRSRRPAVKSKRGSAAHNRRQTRLVPIPVKRVRPWLLDQKVAERCLREYNKDPTVLAQERRAFSAIPSGFVRRRFGEQLRALSAAYSARTSLADLEIIAEAIDGDWTRWQRFISSLHPLSEAEADPQTTTSLLSYFLEQPTARRPRSLATKALHFAAPQAFAIGDSVACNYLAQQLGTAPWPATPRLGAQDMAAWWCGYMRTLRAITEDNQAAMAHLLSVDCQSSTLAGFERVRGMPKILDKILWWAGKDSGEGDDVRLFKLKS